MRRLAASFLVAAAVLAATVAWGSFAATSTVLNPARTEQVAEALVADDAVRNAVEDALTRALVEAVPPSTQVPDAELRVAARRALDDPRVRAVLQAAIGEAHRRMLGEGDGPIPVDAGTIAVAGREALLAAHPELAGTLPAPPPLTVALPTEGFPDLGGLRETAGDLPAAAAQMAAAVFLVALVVAADRSRVLRRAGVFGLWTGGGWFALGWLVPWAVSHWSVDGRLAVLGSLALAVAGPMIVPAAALVIAGGTCFWLSWTWAKLSASRQAAKTPAPVADGPLWQPVSMPKLNPPALPLGHPASKVDTHPGG